MGKKRTTADESHHAIGLDEAEVGLLTGTDSLFVKPNKNRAFPFFDSPLKDKKRPLKITSSHRLDEGKRNERKGKDSASFADYLKMDDECNRTLDTDGSVSLLLSMYRRNRKQNKENTSMDSGYNGTLDTCSVSLLTYPTMNEIERTRCSYGKGSSFTCCVTNLTKGKRRMEDDASLDHIPAMHLKQILTKNRSNAPPYEIMNGDTINNPDVYEVKTKLSQLSPQQVNTEFTAANASTTTCTPSTTFSPNSDKMRSILCGVSKTKSPIDSPSISPTTMQSLLFRSSKAKLSMNSRTVVDLETIQEGENVSDELMLQNKDKRSLKIPRLHLMEQRTSFDEILDIIGVSSSSSSSTSLSTVCAQKSHGQSLGKVSMDNGSTISFSFEDIGYYHNSCSYSNDDDETVYKNDRFEMVAEFNKQFYAHCDKTTNEERKQKIKWWDDEGSVISRNLSSVYGNFSVFSRTSPNKTMSNSKSSFWKFDPIHMILLFFSCDTEAAVDDNDTKRGNYCGNSIKEDYNDYYDEEDDDTITLAESEEDNEDNNDGGTFDLSNGIDGVCNDEITFDLSNGIDGVYDSSSSEEDTLLL